MRDDGVGRVLVASLHQAIGDVLPARLDFYEHWLHVEGLRDGTIHLAPLQAVLSFLRQEGDAYEAIVGRAGEYAAEWTAADLGGLERAFVRGLPPPLRRRWLARMAGRIVRATYRESRASARMRRGAARVEIADSVFCGVRRPGPRPLCGYYAAACARLFLEFGVEAEALVVECRGMGRAACVIDVAPGDRSKPPVGAEAA